MAIRLHMMEVSHTACGLLVSENPFDKKPTLGFSATGALKRSDFGVSSFVPIIGDVVTISIDAEFNQGS